MKSFRFDFTGGVNVVGDKAVLKDQFVTVADNCDLRSGAPRPYRVPQYDHTPPANTTQIFSYRGKWYYSSVDRSYATEYIGGRDRVYFTQYGGIAQKIVDGVQVTLGTNPPKTAPIVDTGATIQTVAVATVIDGGNFGPSRTRSYRIAVETEDGVLPPGSRVTVITPAFIDPNSGIPQVIIDALDLEDGVYAAKAVVLNWAKVKEAINYWIFAGDGADESLLDKVPASVFTYTDYGTKSTTGDLATNYSERFPYTYFYTFERFVNGMVDESGPSPSSPQIESNIGRTIRFDTLGDGFFSQPTAVNITSGITITDSTAPPAIAITNAEYQPALNQVKITTLTAHGLKTFDKARFELTGDANWTGVQYSVTVDATLNTVLYVKNAPDPTATTGTLRASKFQVDVTPAPASPVQDGDIVYVALANAKGWDDRKLNYIIGKAKRNSDTQFIVEGYVDNLSAGVVTSSSVRYVPKNGYIRYRNLYRTGETDAYLLVKQLPLSTTEFIDSVSAGNLGSTPDSFFDQNGVTVVYAVPPLGLTGLVNHYDMLAGIDGHRVRWTVNARPDAWPADFYYDFAFKPVAIASFAQALIVLCEDAIYRIDGNVATDLSISKTMAEDGCIAPLSVQKTSAGLVYLSKRGLMLFDGQYSRCITDQKVKSNFWTGTSNPDPILYAIYPTQFGYQYASLCESDGIKGSMTRGSLNAPTKPIDGVIKDIDSFYHDGKYYIFWRDGYSGNYKSHTCACVDLATQGWPITTLSMRMKDVHVDADENVFVLLPYAPSETTVEITAP